MTACRSFLAVTLLMPLLGCPLLATADDTEVFFSRARAEDQTSNVVFMFDISGSMNRFDGTAQRRIERLKQAMVEILETSDGVNVGIGAFNGTVQGGAILQPAVDPDEDVCAGASCESITVRSVVQDPSDDAEQGADGSVVLDSLDLELTRTVDKSDNADGSLTYFTRSYPIASSADDVVQFGTGTLDATRGELPLFHVAGQAQASIGLRFANVDVPAGATIVSAHLRLVSGASGSSGSMAMSISADASVDAAGGGSPPFADSAGLRVVDRPRLGEKVLWSSSSWWPGSGGIDSSPDLSSLLVDRMAQPDWKAGDALSLMIELPASDEASASIRRHYQSFDGGTAPTLVIEYTTRPLPENRVGLRFADLDIPRGARITSAFVELVARQDDSYPSEMTVRAEATGDAPTFGGTSFELSGRTPTAASATWRPAAWPASGRVERTDDLAAVVQEVVGRSDWCGGNAIALLLEGDGVRIAHARDRGVWDAPVLKVGYDPSSVDFSDTCTTRRVAAAIGEPTDDAEELVGSGTLDRGRTVLDVRRDGADHVVGLRFTGIDVPQGAAVTSARLMLTGAATGAAATTFQIRAEPADDAARLAAGTSLSARTLAASAVSWNAPAASVDERVRSADIGTLIGGVVGRAGWSAGNALVLTLTHAGGTGSHPFRAFEGGAASAARLEIAYRVENEQLPLRTGRDELIDTVLDFRGYFGTPLIDAYYESALYMLGEEVEFGRRRGQQNAMERYFRLSHPSTYTGGDGVYTPPDCSDVDPNAVACVEEEILGQPRYIAPVAGACQVNQIVLLSDGAATSNAAREPIKNLIGASDCEARSDPDEDCALELARWLHEGGTDGRESVVTHTVGFNFSSDFLGQLAEAGGGRFATASSTAELTGAFRDIVENAASIDTGFVAPAATISQFNRLTNRDDVYFAMFRPSPTTRWPGNLKRYRLGKALGSDEIELLDALAEPVLDKVSGNIRDDARSFWTDGADDGADVALGGAANELALPRKLLTYLDTPDDARGKRAVETPSLVEFSEDNLAITALDLGIDAVDPTYRDELLKWARGVDVRDVDGDGDVTEVRRQLGDPMHTTPFVLNYASAEPEGRSLVFLGTNEGFLHAIDTVDGSETFGFIPPDLLPNLDRFYRDESGTDRPYGLDGPIGGWFDDSNGNLVVDPGEKALVWVGMRRGGRNYYALDVSDPDAPRLAWVIRGGEGDFTELGYSWSRPVFTRLLDRGSERDVLIFGAGYDPINDTRESRSVPGEADTMGRGFFIVDAQTGAYLGSRLAPDNSDLGWSIPSDINVLDVDLDGLADMLWVGDMGGQLWRFDIDNTSDGALGSAITGGVVAELGGFSRRENRRFYYPPDIALVKGDGGGVFLNIGIGSGWRAHPLDQEVEDRFYVLRDQDLFGPPRNVSGDIAYTALREADLYDVSTGSTRNDDSGRSANGWYLTFADSGEKVFGAAITVERQLLFTTYVPDDGGGDVCSASVGGGRLYALDALHGDAVLDLAGDDDRFESLDAPGIPPPVSALIPDADQPIGLVGLQKIDKLDFGPSLRRTYWAEQ